MGASSRGRISYNIVSRVGASSRGVLLSGERLIEALRYLF